MLGVFLLLHNEPLPSFIDSLLPVFSPYFSPPPFFDFCSLWFLVLFLLSAGFPPILPPPPFLVAASDLSAPKKCRARFGLDQQNNWCGPCRCVWCVLAPAGARWRLGYLYTGTSSFALPAAAFIFFSSSSLPPPSVCPRQAIVTSQLPPATPCRSISRSSPPLPPHTHNFLIFYLLFGKKGC